MRSTDTKIKTKTQKQTKPTSKWTAQTTDALIQTTYNAVEILCLAFACYVLISFQIKKSWKNDVLIFSLINIQ
jgi:hypothetical protein